MAPSTAGLQYSKDEKVLCFHYAMLYEAKILDVKFDDGGQEARKPYKVHYKGWKNTWDEWVSIDQLRKFNDENKELARALRDSKNPPKSKAATPIGTSAKRKIGASDAIGSDDAGPPKKRSKESKELEGIEKEEDYLRRPAIKLYMPDILKSILVDDWEKVTKDGKIVPLPSKTPVNMFLDDYEDFEKQRRREGSADWEILEEIIAGVREYFNKSLGRLLLYKFERPQWQDLYAKMNTGGDNDFSGKQVADIYGMEHLLRLFVSLPDLIAHTNMDSQAVSRFKEELFKMVQFVARNVQKYFTTAYEHPGDDYTNSTRT